MTPPLPIQTGWHPPARGRASHRSLQPRRGCITPGTAAGSEPLRAIRVAAVRADRHPPSLRCVALPIHSATTTLRRQATAGTTDRSPAISGPDPGGGSRFGDLTS